MPRRAGGSMAMTDRPDSIAAMLQAAVEAHGQGDLAAARRGYEAVLRQSPQQPDALHLLGVVADQEGRPEEAIDLISRAIAISPQAAAFHGNLGNALLACGREADAEAAYRRAVAIDPQYADGHVNLGNLQRRRGDSDAALRHYRDALRVAPRNLAAHLAIGGLLALQRQPESALPHLAIVVRKNPGSAAGRDALGVALSQLGRHSEAAMQHRKAIALAPRDARYRENYANALIRIDSAQALADAAAEYRAVLDIHPERVEAMIGLGAVLVRLHDASAALAVLERARALAPDRFEVLVNYTSALALAGRTDEALSLCDRLATQFPDNCLVLSHRGTAREHAGDYTGALRDYELALQAANNRNADLLAEVEFKRALLLMSLGRLAEGWPLYQARLGLRTADPRAAEFTKRLPAWDGVARPGQRVLIWGEQGLGDQILYGSMLPDMVKRGVDAVFACDPRLVPLFARSVDGLHVEAVRLPVEAAEIDRLAALADVQAGLCDLGAWLRPDMARFPAPRAYLKPEAALVDEFRQRYAAHGKRHVVGITWRSANRKLGHLKSATLTDWLPALRRSDTLFVDMQYGDTAEEIAGLRERHGIEVLHDDSVDAMRDLDRYAAQAAALDLLVGCSNSGVHIAAATGLPCWVLVPGGLGRLWYWHLDRSDSPWYPHVRLFRQAPGAVDGWGAAIGEVAAALQKHFAGGVS